MGLGPVLQPHRPWADEARHGLRSSVSGDRYSGRVTQHLGESSAHGQPVTHDTVYGHGSPFLREQLRLVRWWRSPRFATAIQLAPGASSTATTRPRVVPLRRNEDAALADENDALKQVRTGERPERRFIRRRRRLNARRPSCCTKPDIKVDHAVRSPTGLTTTRHGAGGRASSPPPAVRPPQVVTNKAGSAVGRGPAPVHPQPGLIIVQKAR